LAPCQRGGPAVRLVADRSYDDSRQPSRPADGSMSMPRRYLDGQLATGRQVDDTLPADRTTAVLSCTTCTTHSCCGWRGCWWMTMRQRRTSSWMASRPCIVGGGPFATPPRGNYTSMPRSDPAGSELVPASHRSRPTVGVVQQQVRHQGERTCDPAELRWLQSAQSGRRARPMQQPRYHWSRRGGLGVRDEHAGRADAVVDGVGPAAPPWCSRATLRSPPRAKS
jgi:hypothetical protein